MFFFLISMSTEQEAYKTGQETHACACPWNLATYIVAGLQVIEYIILPRSQHFEIQELESKTLIIPKCSSSTDFIKEINWK